MPKIAWMLIGLIVVTACAEPTRSAGTTGHSPKAPIQKSTTTSPPVIGPIRGALPDGTIYDIAFPAPRAETVGQIQAELIVEVGDKDVSLGVVFRQGTMNNSPAELVLPAGGWTVAIDIPDSVDGDARAAIGDAIEVTTEVEMPVLILQPPLRWSGPPQVTYDTFTVRGGCPEEATACNPTHAVSVVPRSGAHLETPISVQSYALRPESDPNHLPSGPLSARWSADVVWTGEEMVVWGGSADPGPSTLIDGAAYDPGTGEWRMLSPPLTAEQSTRAVWSAQEMVVLGEEAAVGWDPKGDRWRVMANGVIPPLDPGMTVTTGSEILAWTSEGLYRLGAAEKWEVLPDPGVGDPYLHNGSVLRVVGSTLFAVGQEGCDRLVTRWEQGSWSEPTQISFGGPEPVCGHPNQSAVVDDTLVLWDDTSAEVVSYHPASGTINQMPPFPLPAMDQAPGPLNLDDGFLVTAGLDAVIFELPGQWRTVQLPGLGNDVDMVWTGDEILMWGKCCYGPDDIDAWRWVPPSP